MNNFVIYVEKRPGFDVEAQAIQNELVEFLGIKTIKHVRLINRYDVAGITREVYEEALKTVFSEPQSDRVYEGDLPQLEGFIFMSSFVNGQYDQRADSCMQCIRSIDYTMMPLVKASKVYAIEGALQEKDITHIKKHLINPIESEEVALDAHDLLDTSYPIPENVKVLEGFIYLSEKALEAFRKKKALQ